MRILVLVIMILTFLIGGGSSSLLKLNVDTRTKNIDYKELAETQIKIDKLKAEGIDLEKYDDPTITNALEVLEKTPSKWQVTLTGVLGIIIGIVSLFMVVVAFMKKEIVKKVSISVIVLSALLWLLTPSIEAGITSGANPKNIALVAFVGLLIASISAFMSYKMHLKKAVTA